MRLDCGYFQVLLKASSTMHDTVFLKVFRSPMSFFDTTPTGRILNRFSKDLDEGTKRASRSDVVFYLSDLTE